MGEGVQGSGVVGRRVCVRGKRPGEEMCGCSASGEGGSQHARSTRNKFQIGRARARSATTFSVHDGMVSSRATQNPHGGKKEKITLGEIRRPPAFGKRSAAAAERPLECRRVAAAACRSLRQISHSPRARNSAAAAGRPFPASPGHRSHVNCSRVFTFAVSAEVIRPDSITPSQTTDLDRCLLRERQPGILENGCELRPASGSVG